MSLKSAKIFEVIYFFIGLVVTYYYMWRAVSGKLKDPLRVMPQVVAIEDGVDKAVEEGKHIYVNPGNMSYLSGLFAPMTISGMNIMRYTARLAVRKGAKIRFLVPYSAEALPLMDGIYREVCVSEGKPEAYNREEVRYHGGSEASWSAGAAGDIASTGCSLIICAGACSSAEMFFMGYGKGDGALVIGGTPRWTHQGTYTAYADYPLYCEDLYGAGALASGSDEVGSFQVGGDVMKLILIGVIVLFTILGAAGLSTWQKTTGWLNI